MKNSHTFAKSALEFVALTVKRGQLGDNADTFICIFSVDALGFSVAFFSL